MWHNVIILLVYLAIFHFIVRTHDLYNELLGFDKPFIQPITLNAKQLRALLNHRGILYTGIVEKPELTNLVDLSGRVTEADLEDAVVQSSDESTEYSPPSHWLHEQVEKEVQQFTGAAHFYEQVEDSKDSAWIVQIVAKDSFPIVNDLLWHQLIYKLNRFGIRFGILYCKLDKRMCEQRNWNTSRLLLALPHEHHAKSNVVLYTYNDGNYRTQSLIQWVYSLMKQKVHHLNTTTDVSHWISNSCAADVCLLLVSTLTLPPFFLSALSIKFTGRVKFGACSQRTLRSTTAAQQLSIEPADQTHHPETNGNTGEYVVVSDGRAVQYGRVPRERVSFTVLQTYLKWLAPDINDVFLLSLAATNILALMTLFDLRGTPIQCMFHLLVALFKYNFCLLLVWIAILSVINWKSTITVCKFLNAVLRRFATSTVGRGFIADWSMAAGSRTGLLGFTFFTFSSIIYYLRRRFFPSSLSQTESWSEWLRSTNFSVPTLPEMPAFSYNFYVSNNDVRMDSFDPRLLALIRRYTILQIYMQPTVSYSYILDLPFWYYDTTEDLETGRSCRGKLCFRCLCVKSLKLKNLSKKLNRRPCSKCGYSGVQQACTNANAEKIPVSYSTDSSACPICLDLFNRGDILCGLPCKHVYHQRCILSWLLRDQPSCPCCRWPAYERKEKVS